MKIINLDKYEKVPECKNEFHIMNKCELEDYSKKDWHVETCIVCNIFIVQRKGGSL